MCFVVVERLFTITNHEPSLVVWVRCLGVCLCAQHRFIWKPFCSLSPSFRYCMFFFHASSWAYVWRVLTMGDAPRSENDHTVWSNTTKYG